MDKTMTRRIIGVLVVFALVIILLPLLFNTNVSQSPLQTSEIKAPPFPDQQANTSVAPATVAQNAASAAVAGEKIPDAPQAVAQGSEVAFATPNDADAEANTTTIANTDVASAVPSVNDLKVDVDPVIQVADAANDSPVIAVKPGSEHMAKPAAKSVTVASNKSATKKPVNPAHTPSQAQTQAQAAHAPHVTLVPAAAEDSVNSSVATRVAEANLRGDLHKVDDSQIDLSKLKKTAWVIQMGSFRDKNNAERLTNSLRAKGYKAFTFATKSNGQTRVYVGPEFKQVAASTTANKIAQEMKMRGFVLSYKPLEL